VAAILGGKGFQTVVAVSAATTLLQLRLRTAASTADALFIFIQQLAHLLDG